MCAPPNCRREIWSADSAKAPSSGAADFFPGLSVLSEGWSDEWHRMGTPSRSDTYTPRSPRTCSRAAEVTLVFHSRYLCSLY